MILICGLYDEPVVEKLLAYMLKNNVDFCLIDERDYSKKVFLDYTIYKDKIEGRIDYGSWHVDFEKITGVFNRLGMMNNSQPADYYNKTPLSTFLDIFPRPVLNRPYALYSNASKIAQYAYIIEAGLNVPNTFVGYNKPDLNSFINVNGEIITKSVSSIRSLVKEVDTVDIPQILNSDYKHIHQFQKKIVGRNIRAHVLNDQIFACEAVTDYLDYRYARSKGSTLDLVPCQLPLDIANKCIKLNQLLDLEFSGIDLIRTDDDEWYCFEVNTSPGYSWFEENAALPITKNLVNYLLGSDY